MKIQFPNIAIVGTGAMGRGIAQIAAQAGSQVFLLDANPGAADAAKLGAAVNSFVSGTAKSLNITIDAKSAPGLGLEDFMAAEEDPTTLLGKVNISATAK